MTSQVALSTSGPEDESERTQDSFISQPPPSPSPGVIRESGSLVDMAFLPDDGNLAVTEMNLAKFISVHFDTLNGKLFALKKIVEAIRTAVPTARSQWVDQGLHGLAARRIGAELLVVREGGRRQTYVVFDAELLRRCRQRVRAIAKLDLIVETL